MRLRRRGLTIPKAPPFDTLGCRAYAAIEKRPTCVREGDGISPYIRSYGCAIILAPMLDRQLDDRPSSEAQKHLQEIEDAADQLNCKKMDRFKRRGFVAFLDLLGYKQIAKTNKTKTISLVVNAIKSSIATTKVRLKEMDYVDDGQPAYTFLGSLFDNIKHAFISDSIYIHQDIPDNNYFPGLPEDNKLIQGYDAYWFAFFVRELYSTLLRNKLPSRCGISYGRYFWDCDTTTIFAGPSPVEAYGLSESLEFTGVALHESITSGFSERLEMVDRAKDILFPLKDVPVKCKDTPTGCKTVPGVILRPNLSRDEIGDIRQFITEQFKSYGKGIERNDVKRKLENSIRVFGQLYR